MVEKRLVRLVGLLSMLLSVALILSGSLLGVVAYSTETVSVEEVVIERVARSSRYSITFHLRPNEIFGETLEYQGEGVPIYLSLLDRVTLNYSYSLSKGSATGVYEVVVKLAHPDGWAKDVFRERQEFSDKRVVRSVVTLSAQELLSTMQRLLAQIDAKVTAFDVVVATSVNGTVKAGPMVRRDSLQHSITISVDAVRGRVFVRGEPENVQAMEEKSRRVVPNTVFGVPVATLRQVAPPLLAAGAVTLSVGVFLYQRSSEEPGPVRLERKYSSVIVCGTDLPQPASAVKVVVKDLEELVKIARALEKPVVKVCGKSSGRVYFVVDEAAIYVAEYAEA